MTDLEKQLDLLASSWKVKALAFEQECFRSWSDHREARELLQAVKVVVDGKQTPAQKVLALKTLLP